MPFPPLAVGALALCALGFAGLDLLRKVLAGRVRPLPLLVYLALGPAPLFGIWWAWAGPAAPAAGYWPPGLGSVALNVAANLAMLQAVRVSPLSLTIPLLSLTPVFTALISIPLLGEVPTAGQWLGIALVVVGAFVLQFGGQRRSGRELLAAFAHEPGSLLMVGVALCWSLAMPLDKLAMAASSAPFHGLALNLGVGSASLLLLLGAGRVGELAVERSQAGAMVAAVLVGAAAIAGQLVALGAIAAGVVETIKRGVGNLLAVLLGAAVFGERIRASKLVGIVLMALGVGWIVLG